MGESINADGSVGIAVYYFIRYFSNGVVNNFIDIHIQ
jgi:hypothetical protein